MSISTSPATQHTRSFSEKSSESAQRRNDSRSTTQSGTVTSTDSDWKVTRGNRGIATCPFRFMLTPLASWNTGTDRRGQQFCGDSEPEKCTHTVSLQQGLSE